MIVDLLLNNVIFSNVTSNYFIVNLPKKKKFAINLLNYKLFLIVGANRSHRYYSPRKGLGLWPNTQSEDKSVSEDDKLRKK